MLRANIDCSIYARDRMREERAPRILCSSLGNEDLPIRKDINVHEPLI